MTAQELWKEGRLEEAIDAQISEVRENPTDAERRYLLFALVCFSGDLERASKQLEAIGIQDEKLQAGTLVYFNLLASEAERRRAYQGEDPPLTPEEEYPALAARVEALAAWGRGERVTAVERVSAASEIESAARPRLRVDGTEFEGAEDTDELVGPCLEVFAGGRCLWLPFAHVESLEISEPKHLLDLMWIPAELSDVGGNQASVHLPALYPGSHDEAPELALGRSTEWKELDGLVRGVGQRVYAFGSDGDPENDRPLLSIRRLERIADEG